MEVIGDGRVDWAGAGNRIWGRNSAFVLACVEKIAGKKMAVLSAGTDGIDGNSSGAGAVADGQTLHRAREEGLDSEEIFRRKGAFTFFSKLGGAILGGTTGKKLVWLRVMPAGCTKKRK